MNRIMGGGGESRLAVEIRGHDLADAKRLAQDTKAVMDRTPGIADVRVGRDEGRPELAIRVDRPKAAMLGLTVSGIANTIQTNVAGTQAAFFRERGYEYPIVVRLREEDRGRVSDVSDILISTPQGQVLQAKNLMKVETEQGPVEIQRKNQERHHARERRARDDAQPRRSTRSTSACRDLRVPQDFSVGFGTGGRGTAARVRSAPAHVDSGDRPRVRGDGVAGTSR